MPSARRLHLLPVLGLLAAAVGQAALDDSDKQLQEAGLQSCLDGFVVHRDKIIRTQDSREMGAKYLNEVDVNDRLDCMRWCCETEHCDVFIFEEKKPGSCYLFHCGPPHDFKCKFTNHANYSSAVLTNYNLQSPAALEEQMRRNQQEHELKSLRKLEPPSKEYNYFTNAPTTTSTTPAPIPLTTSTTPEPVRAPLCSRNQFECRSNDDCIAIYNVCDGIPQCADGSDEAADLGCPVDRTTNPPPPPPPPPVAPSPKPYVPALLPDVIRYQQMMQQQQLHGQYPMVYGGGHVPESAAKGWPVQGNPLPQHLPPGAEASYGGYIRQQQQQQQQQPQPQSPDESAIVGGAGGMGQPQLPVNYKPPGYQWNNYPAPIYEQSPDKISNGAALDVMHAQNALPPAYEQEQPPHIFNHKAPGMRMDEMEAQNNMYGQNPNRGYAPYYPAVMHHVEPSWQEGNQAPSAHIPVATAAPPHEHPPPETKKHATTSTTPPPCDPEKEEEASKIQNSSNDKKSQKVEVHKSVHVPQAREEEPRVDVGESHKSKPTPQNTVKADNHIVHEMELRKMAETHLQDSKGIAIAEHIRRHGTKLEDLEISRPKGAVISLALGLTVTAVMAVLIACRLRVVKRRGRGRGHDSYAHDADYLVNGMYL